MGLFLSFYLNFEDVEKQEWETAYEETVSILQKFPIPLMRLMEEEKLGKTRLVWSNNLVDELETTNEHWSLVGDSWSFKTGETFELYRNLTEKIKEKKVGKATSKHSIFYNSANYDYHDPEFGVGVFGSMANKTQGYPFHLAILAVGITLENSLNKSESNHSIRGYVSGDYDERQAQEVVNWLEATTGKTVLMPICCDGERLWNAVSKANPKQKRAIKRFLEICKFDTETAYKHIAKFAGKQALFELLAEEIYTYSSITQLGAERIWLNILAIWQDIDVLLEFIDLANQFKEKEKTKKDKEKKYFILEELLRSLCDEYVFVNPMAKEHLNILHQESEDLTTIEDSLMQVMMLMGGSRKSNIQLYIPKEEIWEAFMAKDPKNAQLYKEILDKAEIDNHEKLTKLSEKINKIETEIETQTENAQNKNAKQKIDEDEIKEQKILAECKETDYYIIKQTLKQMPKFDKLSKSLSGFGKGIKKMVVEYNEKVPKKDQINYDTKEEYLKQIYGFSRQAGFALSEKTWKAIDALTDVTLLQMFTMLSRLKIEDADNWKWRIYAFEFVEEWHHFKGKAIENQTK